MLTPKEEAELLHACANGKRKAQRRLYDLFSGQMYVVCLRYSQNEDEAKDILQDAFIKIFNKISSFRGESRLQYWIKRVVINTAINSQRNKHHLVPVSNIRKDSATIKDEEIIHSFNWEHLLKLIQTLPEGCRAIFNLYAIEGYNHREIAELLEISEGTSKSQYYRARMLLQEQLNKESLNYGTTG